MFIGRRRREFDSVDVWMTALAAMVVIWCFEICSAGRRWRVAEMKHCCWTFRYGCRVEKYLEKLTSIGSKDLVDIRPLFHRPEV